MHLHTKLELLKHVDSYWLILPPEIRTLIVKYKESQELIEWRESEVSRALCQQIILYRKVWYGWFVGPIQCQCVHARVWGQPVIEMRVFGYYHDLDGESHRMFLGYTLEEALQECVRAKNGLWFQMDALNLIRLLSEAR